MLSKRWLNCGLVITDKGSESQNNRSASENSTAQHNSITYTMLNHFLARV